MYKEGYRAAWVEISTANLKYNVESIRNKAGKAPLIGVIKADAYGHGMVGVAKILDECGVETFAVATLKEAMDLRKAGFEQDIFMLGLTPDMYAEEIATYDIMPVVCEFGNAKALSDAAAKQGKTLKGYIAVDTGMGRIGYLPEDPAAVSDIAKIATLPNFDIQGIFSHFSTADEVDLTYSRGQIEKFELFEKRLREAGLNIPTKTLANSGAIMQLPGAYYDAVRPGIILYGLYPSTEVDKDLLSIKPVMSVKANIIHLKDVPEGFSVGYGRRFISKRPSKIATLSIGYADGYPRPYSPFGKVIVNGVFAPIAGNVCMDQCMVDVTDVPNVKKGDECILLGSDGNLTITADDFAEKTGTINYEIACAFGQRLPKIYV